MQTYTVLFIFFLPYAANRNGIIGTNFNHHKSNATTFFRIVQVFDLIICKVQFFFVPLQSETKCHYETI